MQHLSGRRVFGLIFGLAIAAVGPAYAQDTTDVGRSAIDTTAPGAGAVDTGGVDTSATRDTTDTSAVQSPSGYQGMERDTTLLPEAGADSTTVGETEPIKEEAPTPRLDPSESPGAGDATNQDSPQ